MKNFSELLRRLNTSKERTSELEDRSIKVTQTETQREKGVKTNKQTEPSRAIQYQSNIHLIEIPEGEEQSRTSI